MGVHYDASWTNNRVHFVSPARGNNAARGGEGYSRREREKLCFAPNLYNHGDLVPLSNFRHLESAAMFFCRLLLRPGKEKDCWSMKERERERNDWIRKSNGKTGGVGKKKTDYGKWRGMLDDLLTYSSGRRMEDWKENRGIDEFQSCTDNSNYSLTRWNGLFGTMFSR